MVTVLATPPKLRAGDQVAIVSPSWAGAGVYPTVHEMGVRILRERFGLVPVEYPTTRLVGASPEDRARDLNAAFADPDIHAILAVIGGSDQLRVLPYLDGELLAANPKPFVGYSDNTNLLNYLWNLGMVSYHGGSTMVHLARPGGAHPVFLDSLRHALFTRETVELAPLMNFTDLQPDWADPSTLTFALSTSEEPGWQWHHADRVVQGPTWGGNLEILHWNLAANRWLQPNEAYRGVVFILETSEDMPSSDEVYFMLRNMGERGLLAKFAAVILAKAKAWSPENPRDRDQRTTYRVDQEAAVLRALDEYNPGVMCVVGPDFGHTDPQYIVPYGGLVRVDGPARRITMSY